MVNNILIEVLGTIAEQERLTIHQRQAEGIAAAKAKLESEIQVAKDAAKAAEEAAAAEAPAEAPAEA